MTNAPRNIPRDLLQERIEELEAVVADLRKQLLYIRPNWIPRAPGHQPPTEQR